jgi:hypothetical protein
MCSDDLYVGVIIYFYEQRTWKKDTLPLRIDQKATLILMLSIEYYKIYPLCA